MAVPTCTYHGFIQMGGPKYIAIKNEEELNALPPQLFNILKKKVDFNGRNIFLIYEKDFSQTAVYKISTVAKEALVDFVALKRTKATPQFGFDSQMPGHLVITTPKEIESVTIEKRTLDVTEEPEFSGYVDLSYELQKIENEMTNPRFEISSYYKNNEYQQELWFQSLSDGDKTLAKKYIETKSKNNSSDLEERMKRLEERITLSKFLDCIL